MAFALAASSGAQVAGVAPVAAARGRSAVRRSDAVAAHKADASRGRSVSLSPAPGARSRSLSVGAGNVSARGGARFAGAAPRTVLRASVVKVYAESGVYDPAEVRFFFRRRCPHGL